MVACVRAAEVDPWSCVARGEVIVLTSVLRSMVENVSSPTLLMRDVMRLVRDVVVVVAAFGVPVTVDTPLIPVTSRIVMARTESFL